MDNSGFGKFDLKRLPQGGALCGVPAAGFVSGGFTGGATIDGILPLVVLLGAFVGVGVWMFQRWGGSSETQSPPELAPGAAVSARQGDEPARA